MKRLLTVILGLVMVLALGSAAAATGMSANFGGTLQLGYFENAPEDQLEDLSWFSYYQLTLDVSKDFGNVGKAGASFKTSGGMWGTNTPWGIPWNAGGSWGGPGGFGFNSWYYDYKLSDAVTVGLTGAAGGVSISDGDLTNNSDWQKVCGFKNSVNYGSAKAGPLPTVFKVVAKPVDGLTAQLYYYPVDNTYIIKGVYQGENFKIGGGYNNISGEISHEVTDEQGTKTYYSKLGDDSALFSWKGDREAEHPDLPLNWAIYGEFSPVDGVKIGAEYREDEDYLLSASAQVLDELKLDFLYSTRSKLSGGYVLYRAYTADIKAAYDLGDGNIITGGIAFDTHQSEISRVYAEYAFDKVTVGISDELLKEIVTGDPRGTLASQPNGAYGISLYGSYKLEDGNTVKFSYNLENKIWAAYMQISLW